MTGGRQNSGQEDYRIFDRITDKYWTGGIQNIEQEDGIKTALDFRIHVCTQRKDNKNTPASGRDDLKVGPWEMFYLI